MATDTTPSPISTGGAGTLFEQQVNAAFLAALLVRAYPPCMTDCVLEEVHSQTAPAGWKTDDLLLVGVDGCGVRHQLAAQLKRSFTVSQKNEDAKKTFLGFWDDFSATERFNQATDRLALITQLGSTTLLRHLSGLLDCARASRDAIDFTRRLTQPGSYLHKTARHYAKEIRAIIDSGADGPISDEDLCALLRSIYVLSYDAGTATNQTTSWAKTLLSTTCSGADATTVAEASWGELLTQASSAMRDGGVLRRDDLPEVLRARHPEAVEHTALRALGDHSADVIDSIRDSIADSFSIPRDGITTTILTRLREHQVVVVTGAAGSGKSAAAKAVYRALAADYSCFAFRAEEFAVPHLDGALASAQVGANTEKLFGLLAAHDRKIVFVDSVERLLEKPVRDAFGDLMRRARRDPSLHVVITCRDYSLDTVRGSLLDQVGAEHALLAIPALTDEELDAVVAEIPSLSRPASHPTLRELFRNPYLLDKAARMHWPAEQELPGDERSFRGKFWTDVVRVDSESGEALPQRRERALIELSLRRARSLSLFAACADLDQPALERLAAQNLVTFDPETKTRVAPAHDVLEDWAIIQWLDERYAHHEHQPQPISEDLGAYPALRRAYRKWLAERLKHDRVGAYALATTVLAAEDLPRYFRDDTLVAILLSSAATAFLNDNRALLLAAKCALLRRVIHILRVACKTAPRWLRSARGLPSAFLVPLGEAWAATLAIVRSEIELFLPWDKALLIGFVEDWASGVAYWDPYPSGSEDAAAIALTVLPTADDYHSGDLQKRALKVIAKIPRANAAGFLALVERGRTGDRGDRGAKEFAELLLKGVDGTIACRDFPDEMIALARAQFMRTEEDLGPPGGFGISTDIGCYFGVRDHLNFDFFPASSIRGPFPALLAHHPGKGIEFIIGLLNHAATWYAEARWPGFRLEQLFEARLHVPGHGVVTHWANGRFWLIYRGMSVAPYMLQSALMALEGWLLAKAKNQDVELEALLCRLLVESNNCAIASVVASVASAYPAVAGRAGLALLTSEPYIDMDAHRREQEGRGGGVRTGLLELGSAADQVYANEREESDALEHRADDLLLTALKLQLTEHRDAVLQIIDTHLSLLPAPDAQSEEQKLWRLRLHRMDTRNFEATTIAEIEAEVGATVTSPDVFRTQTVFKATAPAPDLQELIAQREPEALRRLAPLALANWGFAAWEHRSAVDSDEWRGKLAQARELEPKLAEADIIERAGPGFVAAVCIRDHLEELDDGEREWCVRRVVDEIEQGCDSTDPVSRSGSSSLEATCPAASILPRVRATLGVNYLDGLAAEGLSRALTHSCTDVVLSACGGVGKYMLSEHPDFAKHCVGALLRRARETTVLLEAERELPYEEQRHPLVLDRVCVAEARTILVSGAGVDAVSELEAVDPSSFPAQDAIRASIRALSYAPEDALTRSLYERIVAWVVESWSDDERHGLDSYEFDRTLRVALARFVLSLSSEDAIQLLSPVLDVVADHPSEVGALVELLVEEDDVAGRPTPFWDIWQAITDRFLEAPWVEQFSASGSPFGEALLRALFLGTGWKKNIRHWHRLEHSDGCVDRLFCSLPASDAPLEAYCRFLFQIGAHSLPEAFIPVATATTEHQGALPLSYGETAILLESLLGRYVYSEPARLKSNPKLREAIVTILDALVEVGSSAAYKMRDDFVTPLPPAE